MTRETHDSLWRDFPKTAGEFEARFATEEDCRLLDRGPLGRYAHVRALQLDAAVERASATASFSSVRTAASRLA